MRKLHIKTLTRSLHWSTSHSARTHISLNANSTYTPIYSHMCLSYEKTRPNLHDRSPDPVEFYNGYDFPNAETNKGFILEVSLFMHNKNRQGQINLAFIQGCRIFGLRTGNLDLTDATLVVRNANKAMVGPMVRYDRDCVR